MFTSFIRKYKFNYLYIIIVLITVKQFNFVCFLIVIADKGSSEYLLNPLHTLFLKDEVWSYLLFVYHYQ